MRRLLAIATVALSVVALGGVAGAMTSTSTPDGDATPAVVSLLIQLSDPSAAVSVCSGTLVSPTVVVTASHCVAFLDDFAIERLFVTNDPTLAADANAIIPLASIAHLSPVATLHLNPAYKEAMGTDLYREDVSALVVSDAASLSRPGGIDLPRLPTAGLLDQLQAAKALDSTPFTVMGYGTEQQLVGGGPKTFPESNERRSAVLYANSLNPQWVHQAQKLKADTGGACYGDSGGPSFISNAGHPTLVAVTSTGDMPCWATNVSSRIDRPSVLAFLAPIIAGS
jgi:hypothetical protein